MLNHFIDSWTSTCFRIIHSSIEINYEIVDLACMILVNSCIDKHNELILQAHSDKLPAHNFTLLVEKVFQNITFTIEQNDFVDTDQQELDMLVKESQLNWPLRFIDHLFEKHFIKTMFLTDVYKQMQLNHRICLLKLLKLNMSKQVEKKVDFDLVNLQQIIELYSNATREFLSFISSPVSESVDSSLLVNIYLVEIKYLAFVLSDLLTDDEEHAKINYAQENKSLLSNTCDLLKEIQDNANLKCLFYLFKNEAAFSNVHSGSANLKSELIRLIGILIYNHIGNQHMLVENQVLDLIANKNLDMDIENPFLREWSILALKHILINNDYK